MSQKLGSVAGIIEGEAGPVTGRSIRALDRRLSDLETRLNIVTKNNRLTIPHNDLSNLPFADSGHTGFASSVQLTSGLAAKADSVTTLTAGDGLTGGGDLSANRTFTVGAGAGISVAVDAVAVDQAFSPTWTGTHIFNTNRVTFSAGVGLGANGTATTAVADGAAAIGVDLQDTVARTQGFAFRLTNTNSSSELMKVTWDGRYVFGYSSTLNAQTGHVLGFIQNDNTSPTGSPHYVGILASIQHSDTAETAAKLFGIVGNAHVSTATGLTPTVVGGVCGSFTSSSLSTVGAVYAGNFVAGAFGLTNSLANMEPVTLNASTAGTAMGGGNYALWANYLGYCTAYTGTVGLPATGNRPAIGCTLYAPIQKWPAGTTAGAAQGATWGIYGDAPDNGSASNFPATTGFMRIPYPRRTGGTAPAVHATQLYFEPWTNTTTIRGGALEGDVYFDEGTNFRDGLWEYAAGAWHKLLQTQAVDALGGGAAPTFGTIGGTGPTAAAQATWLRVVGTNGTTYWIPAWV